MINYRKGKNVEEELTVDKIPIEHLPEDFLWMKVNGGTKLTNVVDYAVEAVTKGQYRDVLWTGSGGGGVSKTVSCAEIMKRSFDMKQITRIKYNLTEEHWEPQIDGLDPIIVKRYIPTIFIYLTLNDIDIRQLGYQSSQTKTGMWMEPVGSHNKANVKSRGGGGGPNRSSGGDHSGSRNNNRRSGGGGNNNRGKRNNSQPQGNGTPRDKNSKPSSTVASQMNVD